jgi:hypothetical protein
MGKSDLQRQAPVVSPTKPQSKLLIDRLKRMWKNSQGGFSLQNESFWANSDMLIDIIEGGRN